MTDTKKSKSQSENSQTGEFFGRIYAIPTMLKLYHWHVSGKGSYAEHMALDQAIDQLKDPLDRIVETTIALEGDMEIVVPESRAPENIVEYTQQCYEYIDQMREELFEEDFSKSIIDDIQEALQQLLFRLRRLE